MEGLLAGARPQRRGFRVGAGGAGPPLSALMKASVRAELPQSLFTKGHHTRSCPPPVSLNPRLRGQGLFHQDSGCFSSFPPSQIFSR